MDEQLLVLSETEQTSGAAHIAVHRHIQLLMPLTLLRRMEVKLADEVEEGQQVQVAAVTGIAERGESQQTARYGDALLTTQSKQRGVGNERSGGGRKEEGQVRVDRRGRGGE